MSVSQVRAYIKKYIKEHNPKLKEVESISEAQNSRSNGYYIEYGDLVTDSYDSQIYKDSIPVRVYFWSKGKNNLDVRDGLVDDLHSLRLKVTSHINYANQINIKYVSHESTSINKLDNDAKFFEGVMTLSFRLVFSN